MRPGPSTSALAGDVTLGVRLEVMLGRDVLATSVPAWDVILDETSDRVVPGRLTFVAPLEWVPTHPLAVLNNFGQRVHVTQVLTCDGVPSSVEIGWYKIDSWVEQDEGIEVTALDLLTIPDENDLVWPESPPAGATFLSELRRMAAPLPVVLDAGTTNPSVPRNTQYGTRRVENIRDLCSSYSCEYGVQPDGYLHVWAQRDGRDPVAHFAAKDLGTPGARAGQLLSAPRKSLERRANRWTVVGSTGSGDDEKTWSATVKATNAPYEEDTYGVVHARYEMNMATSQSQVQAAAQTYMRNAMITSDTRSLEIPADPRLQIGDVISAHTEAGEFLTGRITAYSLPVSDHATTMRVDVEVLQW